MKIEIIEHCFGPDVRINDESLFKHEYDNRTDDEIFQLRKILIDELVNNLNSLDMRELSEIAEMVVQTSGFEIDEENSSSDDCEQCGNYNYTHVYIKQD